MQFSISHVSLHYVTILRASPRILVALNRWYMGLYEYITQPKSSFSCHLHRRMGQFVCIMKWVNTPFSAADAVESRCSSHNEKQWQANRDSLVAESERWSHRLTMQRVNWPSLKSQRVFKLSSHVLDMVSDLRHPAGSRQKPWFPSHVSQCPRHPVCASSLHNGGDFHTLTYSPKHRDVDQDWIT